MQIECENCGDEGTYPNRREATKDEWRWQELSVAGKLYRVGCCGNCYTEELLETLVLDFEQQAEDEKFGEDLPGTIVKNVGRPQNQTTVDSAGGKSASLTQF